LVKKWVTFYKAHREVLSADIIHLRRPNGLSWDGILHANPEGKEKGLLMLYNPLGSAIEETVRVPVYYTGLRNAVVVRDLDGKTTSLKIDGDYNLALPVIIPARGHTCLILEDLPK
ncbi:MAG: hypothetical protein NT154_34670, partial [Verrucomicrobia bacterium]|nr:hypothetical protein [Verrucomicrobiota bacterium]